MPRLTPVGQYERMKGHGPVPGESLQIHGANGCATECQLRRVLCDARILDIFAAKIQAQVIARRLLSE